MAERPPQQKASSVDKLVDAPIIFFDDVPSVGVRGSVLNAVLAVHIGELTASNQGTDHIVAVANLRFTAATAAKFRDMLDKVLLASSNARSERKPN